ncbi:hypothetical protein [Pseudonocardia sp. ICBG1142]|uniref:hypothetical protein n=1 Tax=Pseudonocardia sp. ICBG1142 TaxID=2846760 RepID=UPI001CF71521|nr:hypothetical protein [Pseudonocardia sp. ICBG1142]
MSTEQIPDYPDVIRVGRQSPTPETAGQWVLLSGASPEAYRFYHVLRVYAEIELPPGQSIWGIVSALPEMTEQKTFEALFELENLGAIDLEEARTPRTSIICYTVHEAPYPGYTGPVDVDDFYDRNPDLHP